MNDILEKYEKDLFANIDKDNLNNIILFLYRENCDYIEDIIEDYLDLFTIPYEQFVDMYSLLNKKYNMEFFKKLNTTFQKSKRRYEFVRRIL